LNTDFDALLESAQTLSDIFEVVKMSVWLIEGKSRGGLMLGTANLGNHPRAFFGAFYPLGSNIIVMNEIPLCRIKETNPDLYKPYIFHVQLHEYLHTLGYFSERAVREKVYQITKAAFGDEHLATLIAMDSNRFFSNRVYPSAFWLPKELKIRLVEGFDRSSANYFA
jgi:hypothetical protein